MARPVKLILAVTLLVLVVGGLVWWWPGAGPAPAERVIDDPSAAPTPTPVPQNTPTAVQSAPVQNTPMATVSETDDVETPADLEPEPMANALESMSNSLSAGDPRTPELAAPYERAKPSADVLADPERYAEYEESQSRAIASAYLSMLNQIPTLRARIDAAKASGSQTPEEIAEAEEALAKLEDLKREMEATHPEMLQPATSSPADSIDESSPE